MRVAIYGTGNVGSLLLCQLMRQSWIEEIQVQSRNPNSLRSAILDAASLAPDRASIIHAVDSIESPDVCVLCAGLQPDDCVDRNKLRWTNLRITEEAIGVMNLSPSTIVITMATPVDLVTSDLANRLSIEPTRLIGFGGDLDTNRLHHTLALRGIDSVDAVAVGEHGRNAIPVYLTESDYTQVAKQVRGFLSTIASHSVRPRNVATGLLISDLLDSIQSDSNRRHVVTLLHPDYDRWITWPASIGRSGIQSVHDVRLGKQADEDLQALIASRD